MNWEEVFKTYPRLSAFKSNTQAHELFEFLAQPESIEKMLYANDELNKPALVGVIKDIEENFHVNSDPSTGMNFHKNINLRRFIGFLIKMILKEFGYEKSIHKNISPSDSKFFKAGTVYVKCGQTHKVIEKQVKAVKLDEIDRIELSGSEHSFKFLSSAKFFEKYELKDKIDGLYMKISENKETYLSSFQAAIELDKAYPGIVGLSGMPITGEKGQNTFTHIVDDYLSENTKKYEKSAMSNILNQSIIFKYNDKSDLLGNFNDSNLFRLKSAKRSDPDKKLNSFTASDLQIASEYFKLFSIGQNIKKLFEKHLNLNLQNYYSIYQIVTLLNTFFPVPNGYSLTAVCTGLELLTAQGKPKNIETAYLSSNNLISISCKNNKWEVSSPLITLIRHIA